MIEMEIRRKVTRAHSPTNFLFPFSGLPFVLYLFSHGLPSLLDTGTGGRRVSARRAGRAELRRTPTGESGVVHRIPTSASRSIGPCPATGEGTSPSATVTRHYRLLGPSEGDVETDGRTGLQHVRCDHLWEPWEHSGCDDHDRQYCASRDRLAIVPHATFIFPQRRRHLRPPRCR